MNRILSVLTLGFLVLSISAQADSYSCYQALESNRRVSKNDALALCSGGTDSGLRSCVDLALDERTLSDFEAKSLCVGASSEAPIRCYQSLRQTRRLRIVVSSNEAQALCRGVNEAEGVAQCLNAADSVRTLSNTEAKLLCSGANDSSPVLCYQKAENDRTLSGSQALSLCRVKDRFRQ